MKQSIVEIAGIKFINIPYNLMTSRDNIFSKWQHYLPTWIMATVELRILLPLLQFRNCSNQDQEISLIMIPAPNQYYICCNLFTMTDVNYPTLLLSAHDVARRKWTPLSVVGTKQRKISPALPSLSKQLLHQSIPEQQTIFITRILLESGK